MTVEALSDVRYLHGNIVLEEKQLVNLEKQERSMLKALQRTEADIEIIRQSEKYAYLADPAYIEEKTEEITSAVVDLRSSIVQRLERDKHKKDKIMRWIDAISDKNLRDSFVLRCLYGWTWEQVASVSGTGCTPDAVKRRCYRYIISNETADL